jgi:hypothetical protein
MTSSRARRALRFTVAQLNFRKDSLREALDIVVQHRDVMPRLTDQTPLARRWSARSTILQCRYTHTLNGQPGTH